MAAKTRFLQCHIEKVESDEVAISVSQADGTRMYGWVAKALLQANLLEVEVLKEKGNLAFIEWPIICPHDFCLGDAFWIPKKFLI